MYYPEGTQSVMNKEQLLKAATKEIRAQNTRLPADVFKKPAPVDKTKMTFEGMLAAFLSSLLCFFGMRFIIFVLSRVWIFVCCHSGAQFNVRSGVCGVIMPRLCAYPPIH